MYVAFYNDEATTEKIRQAAEMRITKPFYVDDNYLPELFEGEQFFCVIECKLKEISISLTGEITTNHRPSKLFMTNYRIIFHRFPHMKTDNLYCTPGRRSSSIAPATPPSRFSRSQSNSGDASHSLTSLIESPKLNKVLMNLTRHCFHKYICM
jgi:hypothetical protein